jgi:transcriptional regulator with XRE-family HTH domain
MGKNEYLNFGDKIRSIRLQKGLTQKEAAERLGLTYSTYSNYENNNRTPKYSILKQIATGFDVSVDELISASFIAPMEIDLKTTEEAERIIDELEKDTTRMLDVEILQNFRKLNKSGKTEAAKRVQELTEIPRYTKPDKEE